MYSVNNNVSGLHLRLSKHIIDVVVLHYSDVGETNIGPSIVHVDK